MKVAFVRLSCVLRCDGIGWLKWGNVQNHRLAAHDVDSKFGSAGNSGAFFVRRWLGARRRVCFREVSELTSRQFPVFLTLNPNLNLNLNLNPELQFLPKLKPPN